MLMKMFAMYDTAAGAYGAPFFSPRVELAQRMITDLLRSNERLPVVWYPHEFTLFELGEFDDSTGLVVSCAPQNLGPVSQWKGNGHG